MLLPEELDVAAQQNPPAAATQEEDQLPLPKELEVAAQDSPRSSVSISASPMSNGFVILPPSPPATPAKHKKREKKVKTDERVECFIRH